MIQDRLRKYTEIWTNHLTIMNADSTWTLSFPATNIILSKHIWLRIYLTGALLSIWFRMFFRIAPKAFSVFLYPFSAVVLFCFPGAISKSAVLCVYFYICHSCVA